MPDSLRVYFGSPASALQADACRDFPVLLSFACVPKWRAIEQWAPSFGRLMLDSGAYSTLNSGVEIDLGKYIDWAQSFGGRVDAFAGLDDIRGDWRRSLANYERGGFPTYHDTDPAELLDDLIPMARERGGWLGIGLLPPRTGRDDWLRRTLDRIPRDIHVHGWALRAYRHHARLDSVDSTNWWRDSFKVLKACPWLTMSEALEIVLKRYKREQIDTYKCEQLTLAAKT